MFKLERLISVNVILIFFIVCDFKKIVISGLVEFVWLLLILTMFTSYFFILTSHL